MISGHFIERKKNQLALAWFYGLLVYNLDPKGKKILCFQVITLPPPLPSGGLKMGVEQRDKKKKGLTIYAKRDSKKTPKQQKITFGTV